MDLRGFACPHLVVELGKALKKLKKGETLELRVGSNQVEDIEAWCEAVGCKIIGRKEDLIRILI